MGHTAFNLPLWILKKSRIVSFEKIFLLDVPQCLPSVRLGCLTLNISNVLSVFHKANTESATL